MNERIIIFPEYLETVEYTPRVFFPPQISLVNSEWGSANSSTSTTRRSRHVTQGYLVYSAFR